MNIHQPDDAESAGQRDRLPFDFGDRRRAQAVRRQRTGAVPRMDPGFLDMFHDAGDLDLPAIGDGIDIDLDCVPQIAVDQDRAGSRYRDGVGNVALQTGRIMHDLHRPAAEDIRRADHDGISDIERDRFGFAGRMRRSVVGLTQPETGQEPLKPLSVLRQIDRIG